MIAYNLLYIYISTFLFIINTLLIYSNQFTILSLSFLLFYVITVFKSYNEQGKDMLTGAYTRMLPCLRVANISHISLLFLQQCRTLICFATKIQA